MLFRLVVATAALALAVPVLRADDTTPSNDPDQDELPAVPGGLSLDDEDEPAAPSPPADNNAEQRKKAEADKRKAEEEAKRKAEEEKDTDKDGLPDKEEYRLQKVHPEWQKDEKSQAYPGGCPNPYNKDTDQDRLTDGEEVDRGTNPCAKPVVPAPAATSTQTSTGPRPNATATATATVNVNDRRQPSSQPASGNPDAGTVEQDGGGHEVIGGGEPDGGGQAQADANANANATARASVSETIQNWRGKLQQWIHDNPTGNAVWDYVAEIPEVRVQYHPWSFNWSAQVTGTYALNAPEPRLTLRLFHPMVKAESPWLRSFYVNAWWESGTVSVGWGPSLMPPWSKFKGEYPYSLLYPLGVKTAVGLDGLVCPAQFSDERGWIDGFCVGAGYKLERRSMEFHVVSDNTGIGVDYFQIPTPIPSGLRFRYDFRATPEVGGRALHWPLAAGVDVDLLNPYLKVQQFAGGPALYGNPPPWPWMQSPLMIAGDVFSVRVWFAFTLPEVVDWWVAEPRAADSRSQPPPPPPEEQPAQ